MEPNPLIYYNYNWEGKYLLKFEGEKELLTLWNICIKANMLSADEDIKSLAQRHSKDIMEVGPKEGFYYITEEDYEKLKKGLDSYA